MVDWPTTLPSEGLTGITDQRVGAKIISENDHGPPNQRRLYTKARRPVNIPIVLTDDERAIFDEWYVDTLQEGVLSFNWKDPRGGATRSFQFREKDGPTWTGIDGGDVKKWSTTLALEIW